MLLAFGFLYLGLAWANFWQVDCYCFATVELTMSTELFHCKQQITANLDFKCCSETVEPRDVCVLNFKKNRQYCHLKRDFFFSTSAAPPQITQFPEDRKVRAGESVELFAKVVGTAPITCTWMKFRKQVHCFLVCFNNNWKSRAGKELQWPILSISLPQELAKSMSFVLDVFPPLLKTFQWWRFHNFY